MWLQDYNTEIFVNILVLKFFFLNGTKQVLYTKKSYQSILIKLLKKGLKSKLFNT